MKLDKIRTVGVLGAGTMGQGIAQVMAQAGYRVFLNDTSRELVEAGLGRMKKGLQKAVEKGLATGEQVEKALSMITPAASLEEAAKAADLVIEAVPENLKLKQDLFRQLDGICKEEAVLATNTSTISITGIASATGKPERVIGMHFMNPVPVTKLVEIVQGLLTSPETVETIKGMTLKLGKEPIIVNDSPGFATSRLGIALYMEASRMLEEGVASVEDIDRAVKLGYSHRMGPFETCDLVGLDARLNNINALYEATRDLLWRPPQLLKRLVMAGYLGNKLGSKGGYYTYFGIK